METLRPRALSRRPMLAAVMPLPSEEVTPPVTKTYFAMGLVLRGFLPFYGPTAGGANAGVGGGRSGARGARRRSRDRAGGSGPAGTDGRGRPSPSRLRRSLVRRNGWPVAGAAGRRPRASASVLRAGPVLLAASRPAAAGRSGGRPVPSNDGESYPRRRGNRGSPTDRSAATARRNATGRSRGVAVPPPVATAAPPALGKWRQPGFGRRPTRAGGRFDHYQWQTAMAPRPDRHPGITAGQPFGDDAGEPGSRRRRARSRRRPRAPRAGR